MTSNGPEVLTPEDPAGNAGCPGSGSHELDLVGSWDALAGQSSLRGATVINGGLLEAASVSTSVCGMPQAHAGGDVIAHPCGEGSDTNCSARPAKEPGMRNTSNPQVNAQVSSFRHVASKLVHPEAPNRPIRATPKWGENLLRGCALVPIICSGYCPPESSASQRAACEADPMATSAYDGEARIAGGLSIQLHSPLLSLPWARPRAC